MCVICKSLPCAFVCVDHVQTHALSQLEVAANGVISALYPDVVSAHTAGYFQLQFSSQ